MELPWESVRKTRQIYPVVKWAGREDEGLPGALLIIIERNPAIRDNLFPCCLGQMHKKTAQCRELALTMFRNIPDINVHLQSPDGLEHYATSVKMRLRRFEESFAKLLCKIPPASGWPCQDDINLICPSFVRLAPILWIYTKTQRKFNNLEIMQGVAKSQLNFCSDVTVYDPQRAAAQIAAQDAVLRVLQDPSRSRCDLTSAYNSPSPGRATSHHLLKPRANAQPIITSNLGLKQDQFYNNFRDVGLQSEEREAYANGVHQIELEILEIKEKAAELERIKIDLVREKRKEMSSRRHQQDSADELPLAKKQRLYGHFEELNSQTQELPSYSSSGPKFHGARACWYLSSDKNNTQDKPSNPWPEHNKFNSSDLFLARCGEEANLARRQVNRATFASPQGELEIVRIFSLKSWKQVHTKDKAPISTNSIHFKEEDIPVVSSWDDLDTARLRTWKQEKAKATRHIKLFPNIVVTDGSRTDEDYIKLEKFEE